MRKATCSEAWYFKTCNALFNLEWLRNMQKKASLSKKTLALCALACSALIVGAILVHAFFRSYFPSSRQTISDIVSEPATYENKAVHVQGTIQRIEVGIIQPFNYWLSDPENQTIRIGVKWFTDADLSGKNAEVIGVVRKGYAWVHPDYPGWWVYFIDANSVNCS